MKVSAVLLARVVFFVESVDLNPFGAAYYPDIVAALVKRYSFLAYPQKLEDFDEQKGVILSGGKFGDKTIVKVAIYNWGLTLDTTSSTRDAEELLVGALTWASENLRLNYNPDMIKRKSYVSQVTFYSEAPLLSLNPLFDVVGDLLSKEASNNLKLPYIFYPSKVSFSIDPEAQRIPVQVFTLERREGVAFSEGKYFSSAPLSTETHLALIEQFEKTARGRKA